MLPAHPDTVAQSSEAEAPAVVSKDKYNQTPSTFNGTAWLENCISKVSEVYSSSVAAQACTHDFQVLTDQMYHAGSSATDLSCQWEPGIPRDMEYQTLRVRGCFN